VVSGCAAVAIGVEIIIVPSIIVMADAKMLAIRMMEIITTLFKPFDGTV
jgi:hypothetical protein